METKRSLLAVWIMRINLACGILSGTAMLLMMVVGTVDIVGSNLDKIGLPSKPLPAAFEFMATMMVAVVFLAISLAQSRRNHIQVGLVMSLLPAGYRKAFIICWARHCSARLPGSAGKAACTAFGSVSSPPV